MIYKCAGCDWEFRQTEYCVEDGRAMVRKEIGDEVGLCPVCTLATIQGIDDDAIVNGVRIRNGRA